MLGGLAGDSQGSPAPGPFVFPSSIRSSDGTPRLRLLSWNVNGLRRCFRKCGFRTLQQFLESLEADIVCVQETKLHNTELDHSLGCPAGWTAFYSCSQVRTGSGYSGVATFCKATVGPPREAYEGLRLPEAGVAQAAQMLNRMRGSAEVEFPDPKSLDTEGRCVVTDHGAFLLFNVYCPAARCTDAHNNVIDEARMLYRYQFLAALYAVLGDALRGGRHILLVGDLNVSPQAIDHCEGAVWERTHRETFQDSPPRRWFDALLQPPPGGAGLADAFRHSWPGRSNAYTCWRQDNGARLTNYGTRIDHVLCDLELLSAGVELCDICPAVLGSDHCPVVACLCGALFPTPNTQLPPPALCAANLPQCRRRQKTLTELLPAAAGENVALQSPAVSLPTCGLSPDTLPLDIDSYDSFFDEAPKGPLPVVGKRKASDPPQRPGKLPRPPVQQRTITTFFPQPRPTTADAQPDVRIALPPDFVSHASSETSSRTLFADSAVVPSTEQVSGSPGDLLKHTSNRAPGEEQPMLAARQDTEGKGCHTFFRQSSQHTPRNIQAPSFLSRKEQEAYLRTAAVAPLCRHGEPCVRRVVAKAGANKGRVFWVCARPQGDPKEPLSRCDHFQWA